MSKSKKGHATLWFSLLVVIGVVIAALASNPSYDDHKTTIKTELANKLQSNLQEKGGAVAGLLGGFISGAVNSQYADALADNMLEYHNYGLFSTTTTTDKDNPKRVSFGIFGKVFPCE